METSHSRPNSTSLLYEAALHGDVATLNSLLAKDPLLLQKISSATPYSETPLHISALAGHLGFAIALLTHNPNLASKLDSVKRSPLHLASAEGHTEIVKALLLADADDVSLAADEDGRIPLHLAAIRGNVESLHELVSARLESGFVKLDGDTVLHLCVKYNHLEALDLLVKHLTKEDDDDSDFINLRMMGTPSCILLSCSSN